MPQITPRYDKNLPELEYHVKQKQLDRKQATRFVEMFKQNLDDVEEDTIMEPGMKTIRDMVEHMPVETLAMEKCDDDGEIKAFYYFHKNIHHSTPKYLFQRTKNHSYFSSHRLRYQNEYEY